MADLGSGQAATAVTDWRLDRLDEFQDNYGVHIGSSSCEPKRWRTVRRPDGHPRHGDPCAGPGHPHYRLNRPGHGTGQRVRRHDRRPARTDPRPGPDRGARAHGRGHFARWSACGPRPVRRSGRGRGHLDALVTAGCRGPRITAASTLAHAVTADDPHQLPHCGNPIPARRSAMSWPATDCLNRAARFRGTGEHTPEHNATARTRNTCSSGSAPRRHRVAGRRFR